MKWESHQRQRHHHEHTLLQQKSMCQSEDRTLQPASEIIRVNTANVVHKVRKQTHTVERLDSPSYPPIAHSLPILAHRATRLRFTFIGATKRHSSFSGSYSSTLKASTII